MMTAIEKFNFNFWVLCPHAMFWLLAINFIAAKSWKTMDKCSGVTCASSNTYKQVANIKFASKGKFKCTHKSGQDKCLFKVAFKTNAMLKGESIFSKYIVTLVEEHTMHEEMRMVQLKYKQQIKL